MAGETSSSSVEDRGTAHPDESTHHEQASLRGAPATFSTSAEEVERILRVQKNYYAVLKVRKDTAAGEVRANYFRASRLVHPDKCSHPRAAEAAAVVNQGYDTLSNPVKKVLYDRYVDDAGDAPEGVSYADWEAQQAVNVQIPVWMERVLRIPGGGICLLIILLPFTLVLVVVCLLLFVLCLPLRIALACCCGVRAQPPHPGGPGIPEDEQPVIIDIHPPAPEQRQGSDKAVPLHKGGEGTGEASGVRGQPGVDAAQTAVSHQPEARTKEAGTYLPPQPVP